MGGREGRLAGEGIAMPQHHIPDPALVSRTRDRQEGAVPGLGQPEPRRGDGEQPKNPPVWVWQFWGLLAGSREEHGRMVVLE